MEIKKGKKRFRNSLEKYGREKYLMKKENEDIFLIIDEKEQE